MMKKFFTFLLMTLSVVPLVACNSGVGAIQSAGTVATTPIGVHTTADEKTLYAAEAAYNATASTYLNAVNHKLLVGTQKDQVKALVQQAKKALDGVRTAYDFFQANSLTAKYANLLSLAAQVKAMVPSS
jgi:hypothetical protein